MIHPAASVQHTIMSGMGGMGAMGMMGGMGGMNMMHHVDALHHMDPAFHDDFLNQISMARREKSRCCTKQKCLNYYKKFLTFMISRVGLMIVMIAYVLAGGLIFETLEAGDERKAIQNGELAIQNMLHKIYKQIEINSTRVKDPSFYYFLKYEIR